MKFSMAMMLLEEGKKVRCTDWSPDLWIDRKGDNSQEPDPYLFWTRCVNKEWELYEEPKKERHQCGDDPFLGYPFNEALFCYEDNCGKLLVRSQSDTWKVTFCPFCGWKPEGK